MINKTYDLKRIKNAVSDNIQLIFLFLLFLIGFVISSVGIQIHPQLKQVITSEVLCNNEITDILYILLLNFLFLILIFFNGFSLIGKPFTFTAIFTYGYLTGMMLTSTFTQTEYLLKFLLSVLPFMFYIISIIAAGIQSVLFSMDLYNNFFKQYGTKTEIRTYLKRYILIVLLMLSGGVVSFILTLIFKRFL